jgi:hypothetical protein
MKLGKRRGWSGKNAMWHDRGNITIWEDKETTLWSPFAELPYDYCHIVMLDPQS